MSTDKQIIKLIQKGLILDIEVELLSPTGNKDEIYVPGVGYYENRKVSNSVGIGARIFKGFFVGGSQRKGHDEITKIDNGYLSISKKGVMFAGQSNTILIQGKQIIRMEPYSDGIGIYKEGRQKEYRFIWEEENVCMQLINIKDDDGRIKILSGGILRQLIQTYTSK